MTQDLREPMTVDELKDLGRGVWRMMKFEKDTSSKRIILVMLESINNRIQDIEK